MTRMDRITTASVGLAELLHGPRLTIDAAERMILDENHLLSFRGVLRHDDRVAAMRADPTLDEAWAVIDARRPDPWVTDGHERDERRAEPFMEPGEWDDEGDGE